MTQKIDLNNLDKSTWKTFKFEDIAQKISKTVKPDEAEVDIYVGLEHIDANDIHIRRKGVPSDVKGGKLRCYPGDVIFGKRRAYQRKAAIVDFDGICSAHAFVFRANEEIIEPKPISFLFTFRPIYAQNGRYFCWRFITNHKLGRFKTTRIPATTKRSTS
ncbi:hypothetical protein [Algibacter pacificus]|uniref:hypothetical protein n=1 Tax=Algibacter pacificus TaxID=2599389 RepID=UPI0011C9032A|nr:hypothetical protein [Algibacter pacificus]